MKHKM